VPGQPDDLLTIDEVITTLRVSRAAFYRWRHRGTGPPSVRLPGGAVRIRRGALAEWLRGLHEDTEEEEDTAA
jgi:excisionase family DNA binding protein